MLFKIRYAIYVVDAPNRIDAKKKIVAMLEDDAASLVSVEDYKSRLPLWKRLLTGK